MTEEEEEVLANARKKEDGTQVSSRVMNVTKKFIELQREKNKSKDKEDGQVRRSFPTRD